MGEELMTCDRCGESRPLGAFAENPKLVYGRFPWCDACIERMRSAKPSEAADLRIAYRRAYAKAFASRIRPATLLRDKRILTDISTGERLGLTYLSNKGIVRITGPWRLYPSGEAILVEIFKADADSVVVIGRGGGRGRRQQKLFRAEAPVDAEAWDDGLDRLTECWRVEVVGKLGRLA